MRAELRVDEAVLERLLVAGVLDREEEEAEKEAEEERTQTDAPAGESAPFPDTRGARLRRAWKKVWRKINGDQAGTSGSLMGHAGCITDLRRS